MVTKTDLDKYIEEHVNRLPKESKEDVRWFYKEGAALMLELLWPMVEAGEFFVGDPDSGTHLAISFNKTLDAVSDIEEKVNESA